jgi:hypothetical protein
MERDETNMATIRDTARDLLKKIPDEVQSKRDAAEFTRLTNGMTHTKLQAEWEKTKQTKTLRTVCIDFVVWYAGQMGIDMMSSIPGTVRDPKVDGYFALEQTLKKCGKGHAWVSAAQGGKPQCGDILRHKPPAFHVDVAFGFEGNVLVRIAGGQSWHPRPTNDVSNEFDNVKRVRGKEDYKPSALEGWLDLERFFEPPPAPIPAWVVGWWKVTWRGAGYYYYLEPDGSARWTQTPPALGTPLPPVKSGPQRGRFTFALPYSVTIRWFDSGSVEVFARNPNANEMTGTWNGGERIEASKIG